MPISTPVAVPLRAAAATGPRPERMRGPDILRGAVILLMVIDHVRWFLSDARFDPTDPTLTTPGLFFTRWITHFCAPVFMLLAGAGARLSLARGRSRRDLARYLLTRGLWLLLLEVTVARFGWQFNLDYGYTGALVFWALGWSMIALAGLVLLPRGAIAAVAFGMILGHNLFDRVEPAAWGAWSWLWTVLHAPGNVALAPGVQLFVLYPLVPWIGVMAAGYLFGAVLELPAERRDRALVRLGLGLTAAFAGLRLLNGYGDPAPWSSQSSWWRTALSFLNTTKYPASLLFLLMTLGPAIAVLPRLDRLRGPIAEAVRTLGRVPLFFWLLHVPVIHLVALALSLSR
ncbi:MAG TPA: heparan-alpha-glucosaminide N-acetyltransferase domain-containing protein, partial [Gemmatimonadales bacterium]|nr:heparan-alpha-glucosaminide N-acetyltransferase domain-containing protein [Gemmatimonadales bacterium]